MDSGQKRGIGVEDFSSLNHAFIFELFPVFPKNKSLATPLEAERLEAAEFEICLTFQLCFPLSTGLLLLSAVWIM